MILQMITLVGVLRFLIPLNENTMDVPMIQMNLQANHKIKYKNILMNEYMDILNIFYMYYLKNIIIMHEFLSSKLIKAFKYD